MSIEAQQERARIVNGMRQRANRLLSVADEIEAHGFAEIPAITRPVVAEPVAMVPVNVGDVWGSLSHTQRASLPLGTRLSHRGGSHVVTKIGPSEWRYAEGDTASEFALDEDRTVTYIPPTVATIVTVPPITRPKIGDKWGDLTTEQRAGLPVGTRLGASYNYDEAPTRTKHGFNNWGTTVYGCVLCDGSINSGRAIDFIPAQVGDRWGDLTDEQKAALPTGVRMEWPAADGGKGVLPITLTACRKWDRDGMLSRDFDFPDRVRTIAYLPTTATA